MNRFDIEHALAEVRAFDTTYLEVAVSAESAASALVGTFGAKRSDPPAA